MPKRKSPYKERPWKPDRKKWAAHLAVLPEDDPEPETPPKPEWEEPKGGWMLFRLDDLTDVKQ